MVLSSGDVFSCFAATTNSGGLGMNRELREQRGIAEENWREVVAERGESRDVRPEVFSSWQRSAQLVPVGLRTAPVTSPERVQQQFAQSRLGRASQVILDDLRDVTSGGDFVAALTDETVTITWMSGGRHMLRRADGVHFTLGGCWSEEAVGTNALALAHQLTRPSIVFSAEHYSPMVHDWVCYSAPILDPANGSSLGVIDVSSLWSKFNPSLLTMVRALARNVEYELARDPQQLDGVVTPAFATTRLKIQTLGASGVWLNDSPIKVSPRQMELLTILSMYERGLSLDELTAFVYGDQPISLTTVKAELSHLRQLLVGVIGSRPYRLNARVDADHVQVLRALKSGDLKTAVALYGGSLLPLSESPEITSWRHQIDVALRDAVIRSSNPELLFQLSGYLPDDEQVAGLTMHAMSDNDVRRGVVVGRRAGY